MYMIPLKNSGGDKINEVIYYIKELVSRKKKKSVRSAPFTDGIDIIISV